MPLNRFENMAQQPFSLASLIEAGNLLYWDLSPTDVRDQLPNGRSMPRIHLGVYMTSGNETVRAVRWALEVQPLRRQISVVRADLRLKAGYRGVRGHLIMCRVTQWLTSPFARKANAVL